MSDEEETVSPVAQTKPAKRTRAKPKPKATTKAKTDKTPEKQMNTSHPVQPKDAKGWRLL